MPAAARSASMPAAYHYRYLGVYDRAVYGKWTATYSGEQALLGFDLGTAGRPDGRRNVVSTEFTPR